MDELLLLLQSRSVLHTFRPCIRQLQICPMCTFPSPPECIVTTHDQEMRMQAVMPYFYKVPVAVSANNPRELLNNRNIIYPSYSKTPLFSRPSPTWQRGTTAQMASSRHPQTPRAAELPSSISPCTLQPRHRPRRPRPVLVAKAVRSKTTRPTRTSRSCTPHWMPRATVLAARAWQACTTRPSAGGGRAATSPRPSWRPASSSRRG